jgi:hypothetical protein
MFWAHYVVYVHGRGKWQMAEIGYLSERRLTFLEGSRAKG